MIHHQTTTHDRSTLPPHHKSEYPNPNRGKSKHDSRRQNLGLSQLDLPRTLIQRSRRKVPTGSKESATRRPSDERVLPTATTEMDFCYQVEQAGPSLFSTPSQANEFADQALRLRKLGDPICLLTDLAVLQSRVTANGYYVPLLKAGDNIAAVLSYNRLPVAYLFVGQNALNQYASDTPWVADINGRAQWGFVLPESLRDLAANLSKFRTQIASESPKAVRASTLPPVLLQAIQSSEWCIGGGWQEQDLLNTCSRAVNAWNRAFGSRLMLTAWTEYHCGDYNAVATDSLGFRAAKLYSSRSQGAVCWVFEPQVAGEVARIVDGENAELRPGSEFVTTLDGGTIPRNYWPRSGGQTY